MDYQQASSPPQQQYHSPVSSQSPSPNPIHHGYSQSWRPPYPQQRPEPAAMAPPPEVGTGIRPKGMSGKFTNICFAFTVIAVPMILFPVILLYLVFAHRVSHGGSVSDNLQLPSGTVQTSSSVYYVNFSATTLVFIASWSSTLALSLVGSVMVLYSYPVASGIMQKSGGNEHAQLPTPYQLSILVGLINGGFGALWSSVKYATRWRGERPGIIPEVWWSMLVMVVVIMLSLLISLADTWLHVTTKTISYIQVSPNTQPSQSLGRGLSSKCLDWYTSGLTGPDGSLDPCSLSVAATNIFLIGSNEAYQTVNNISSNNRVDTVTLDLTYALLLDPSAPPDIDFTANTFAVSTKCTPISEECGLRAAYGASTPFDCPNINFKGDVTSGPGWNMIFFNTSEARYNATVSTSVNPFYWALASNIDGTFNNSPSDPNLVNPVHGGLASVIFCNTTIYDATYSQVNSTVSRIVGTVSNDTVGGIFSGPINPLGGRFGVNQLQNGMHIAAFSDTSQNLANAFADIFSQITAGFAAGVMTPRQNTEEQTRSSLLVASVPKAPLYVLVILNLAYAMLGIVFAVKALSITREGVRDIQAKLSIAGLVAEGFQPHRAGMPVDRVEELFDEWDGNHSGRVVVQKTQLGGWKFNTPNGT